MVRTFRVVSHGLGGTPGEIWDEAVLAHDERRVRRRTIALSRGDSLLVDFPAPVTLRDDDSLVLEDGRQVRIVAAPERLYEVRGRDPAHLMQLCWHVGNRHAKAEIADDRILILRDHVMADMLRGLGATVTEVTAPFSPEDGAYAHDHGTHALLSK